MITQAPALPAEHYIDARDGESNSRLFNFTIEEAEVISLYRRLDECERQGVLEGLRHILRFRPAEAGPAFTRNTVSRRCPNCGSADESDPIQTRTPSEERS